jgi:hypothetical protein
MQKKTIYWVILIIILTVFSLKVFSQEDDWICVDGEWIKHGSPRDPKPTEPCLKGVLTFEDCVEAGNPIMESYPRQCIHNGKTYVEDIGRTDCTPDQRNVDACIEIYQPVCGWFDSEQIVCVKFPCAVTFSNSCFACMDETILYYTEGECPI